MDNTKLKSRMSGKVQELQQPVEVAAGSDTSLVPVDSAYIALTHNTLDIIRANLKSQPLSLDLFDIVKSPSGGGYAARLSESKQHYLREWQSLRSLSVQHVWFKGR